MSGSNLFTGTLDLLILRGLAWGPLHGYAIGRWILESSGDVLQVEEGVLYPALHRLESKGWLKAEWGRTDTNRRAKFYDLTPAGRRALEGEVARWSEHAAAVAAVLDAPRG
jgi:transcriptional regulator